VAYLIQKELGIRYHSGHVWKILRQLHWSPQRPAGRALERNEQAIQHWKRKTSPDIKKKPKKRGARSSSSMKAVEPAAAPLSRLGAAGSDARAAVSFQLGKPFPSLPE